MNVAFVMPMTCCAEQTLDSGLPSCRTLFTNMCDKVLAEFALNAQYVIVFADLMRVGERVNDPLWKVYICKCAIASWGDVAIGTLNRL